MLLKPPITRRTIKIELNLDIKYLFFLSVGYVCVSRFRALSERGLMKRQMHIWHPGPPKCYGTSEVQGVQLKAISLALILLAVGIIMSLVMLVIECCLPHRSQAMQSKQRNSCRWGNISHILTSYALCVLHVSPISSIPYEITVEHSIIHMIRFE